MNSGFAVYSVLSVKYYFASESILILYKMAYIFGIMY